MLLNKLLFPNEKEEGRVVCRRRHCCFMYFCEINEKFNTKCDKISSAHTHIQSALYKAAAVVEGMMAEKSVFMKL